jgi:hypothetical protein
MKIQSKFNKSIFILITGIILLANQLFAQEPRGQRRSEGPPPLPDSTRIVEMVDELSKSLSLDEEQKTKILELHFTHFAEAKELMEESKKDREGHREAMDELRKEFEDQVKNVLTEDQVEEFEEFVKNRQKQQRGNRPKRR